jgi:hypothetical protein
VSWRVLPTDTSRPDFDRLGEDERAALAEDLFGWVENGPHRTNSRLLGTVEIFEDPVPSGFTVAYFVDEAEPCVAILRIRKRPV